jgi:hypothetical protein
VVRQPSRPGHAVPLQRQRESDRSQPGISVIFCRKFTMRTCPKWALTQRAGANHKNIPPQYPHALANRFPYSVTAEIPRVGAPSIIR